MDFRSKGDDIIIRLHPGEIVPDIIGEISEKCGIETAVIVSGVGMLKDVELSYFVGQGKYESHHFAEPLELISLREYFQTGRWIYRTRPRGIGRAGWAFGWRSPDTGKCLGNQRNCALPNSY